MVNGSMRVPSPLRPALEVGAPDAVGIHRMCQRFAIRLGPSPLLARNHQPGPLHHLADGAGGRPRPARLIAFQYPFQFAWSPRHVRLAQFQHRLLDPDRRLVGMKSRRPVQFRQPLHSILPVTPQPHIPSLSRYAELTAQIRHRMLIALVLEHKAQLLFHHTARSPGHVELVNPQHSPVAVSAMSPVQSVRNVTGPYR